MFEIFTKLASLVVYELLQLPQGTKLADSLHFFIEGTTTIFAPLLVMIYLIALLRASLRVEKVRDFLAGKHRAFPLLFQYSGVAGGVYVGGMDC